MRISDWSSDVCSSDLLRQFSCQFLDRSERARRDGGRRGDQRAERRARAGDGRDVHRRAWHRHRQAGMAGRRAGRRGRADADDQARARSAEFAQPRQDLRAVMATQADPLASSNARLTAPATLVPLLLLALVATMGFTALGSFGTIQESAKAELGLTDDALALIQGLGAAVPMVLFSIPIGILVDRRNRVRLTIGLALLWTLGTLLTAFAPSAGLLTAARMLVGIGSTGSLTAALSLCADFCAPEQDRKSTRLNSSH